MKLALSYTELTHSVYSQSSVLPDTRTLNTTSSHLHECVRVHRNLSVCSRPLVRIFSSANLKNKNEKKKTSTEILHCFFTEHILINYICVEHCTKYSVELQLQVEKNVLRPSFKIYK